MPEKYVSGFILLCNIYYSNLQQALTLYLHDAVELLSKAFL